MPKWGRWVATSVGLLVTAVLWVKAGTCLGCKPQDNPSLKMPGIFWAIAPPVWFFFDWYFYKGLRQGPEFDDFKLSQDRAKDIWVGLAAAIAIFFTLKA